MEFSQRISKGQVNKVQNLPNHYLKSIYIILRISNVVVCIMTRLRAERPRISVSISERRKRFTLLQTSRLALKHTPSSIHWVMGTLSAGQSVWGVKLTNSIYLMRRLRMSVTIHSHPAHACMAYRHFYLYFNTVILQLQGFQKCSRFFGFSNKKIFQALIIRPMHDTYKHAVLSLLTS
jgi:hypothetical protein